MTTTMSDQRINKTAERQQWLILAGGVCGLVLALSGGPLALVPFAIAFILTIFY